MEDARNLLDEIVDGRLLRARATWGFFPAHSTGNDLVLFGDAARSEALATFPMLRQQRPRAADGPCLALSDFVSLEGTEDYIGAFAVTAGIGLDELVRRYETDHDDYRAIMVKALADRLAEAFAEQTHQRARRAWGLRAGRRLGRRRSDPGGIPRDPAGARISGLPRPYREAPALRPAGGRGIGSASR